MKNFNIFFTTMLFENNGWQKMDILNAEGKIQGFSGALWREEIFGGEYVIFLVLLRFFFFSG